MWRSFRGRLGFGVGPFTGELDDVTRGAVRRYEAARGLPPSGNPFTIATFERLLSEADRLQREGHLDENQ
ncbi:MAG: peptidoglycan-binding protein [Acidobacteria bacterium]|nr:peptidoglycan-binding protein [Acidobacteriota bacterium]